MKLLLDTHAFLWLVEGSPNLSTTARSALAVATLPNHHRDPFDRILIAQALVDGMTLASADAKFAPYSVPILW